MILTGKAKKHFLAWFKQRNKISDSFKPINIFETLNILYQNALIIEWFDSIKLTICIEPYIPFTNTEVIYFAFRVLNNTNIWEQNTYRDRISATTEAIKKANTIYNERN